VWEGSDGSMGQGLEGQTKTQKKKRKVGQMEGMVLYDIVWWVAGCNVPLPILRPTHVA